MYDEYFCPNCNAILNNQSGFKPEGTWKCMSCGQTLYGEDVYDGIFYKDVMWYCDNCNALLNKQSGFYDYCGNWTCSECGHSNPINEDEILDDDKVEDEEESYYYDERHSYSSSCNSEFWEAMERQRVQEQLEREKIARGNKEKRKAFCKKHWKVIVALLLTTVFTILVGLAYIQIQKLTSIGVASTELIGKPYEDVVHMLENAGFTNITLEEEDNLRIEQISQENLVTRVIVGVDTSFKETKKYPYDTLIVVVYRTVEEIAVPLEPKEIKGKNYEDIYEAFANAGFVNITYEVKYDIVTGWITSDGEVKSVIINGDKDFESGDSYRPDSEIIITYHTYMKNKPE